MHAWPTFKAAQRGFTLVELLAALVIVGILSAIALPRFFDNQTFTERGYADELASALRYARRVAVASSCPVRITINANYAALQRNSCTSGAWNTPVQRADGSNLVGTRPLGVATTPAASTITFTSSGAASSTALLQVGTHFSISVEAGNGFVSVQP